MKVKFWGTRGSLPGIMNTPDIRAKLRYALKEAKGREFVDEREMDKWMEGELPFWVHSTYGVSTACVEIMPEGGGGGEYVFCDAGTGLRNFAYRFSKDKELMSRRHTFHIFLSHLHWDHIQGFPFFTPGFIEGNRIIIHGYHKEAEAAFREMMSEPFFPVPFDAMGADIEFDIREVGEDFEVEGMLVRGIEQTHPGLSYGYRFEGGGKSVVYSTDCEHKEDALGGGYPFIEFFNEADLLIMDGQYRLAEATLEKEDWGHSSNIMCLMLAAKAKAKHLAIVHLEPTSSDEMLYQFEQESLDYMDNHLKEESSSNYPQKLTIAQSGQELEL